MIDANEDFLYKLEKSSGANLSIARLSYCTFYDFSLEHHGYFVDLEIANEPKRLRRNWTARLDAYPGGENAVCFRLASRGFETAEAALASLKHEWDQHWEENA